jgi:hypothetical protein
VKEGVRMVSGKTTGVEEYTAGVKEYTTDTLDRIWAEVQELQTGVYSRRLTRDDIYKALQPVIAHPYGEIAINARCGGRKAPKRGRRTVVWIFWYSWRRKKWVNWACRRIKTWPEDDQKGTIITEQYSRRAAWNEVFPERAHAYESIMLKRRLIREGYVLPPDITDIYLYDEKYGMALISIRTVEESCSGIYLCSPLGYFKLDFYPANVYKAVKSLGIRLPKDTKKRTWENIEPAWVMAQLRKL